MRCSSGFRVNDEISDAIAEVIAEDTSLPAPQAKLLAVSLVGIAQVSARYWISGGTSTITLDGQAAGQQLGLARHQWLPTDRTRQGRAYERFGRTLN